MGDLGFEWIQCSLYLATEKKNNLTYVCKAIGLKI
jgi:virulence-associated protein VapD